MWHHKSEMHLEGREQQRENAECEKMRQAVRLLQAMLFPFLVSQEVLCLQIYAPRELPLLGLLIIIYSFCQQHVGCRDGSISVQVFGFCCTV